MWILILSGITFGVTLEVPWNALKAYVHLHSDGVVALDTVPDVLGGCGLGSTREGCTECMHIDSGSAGPGKRISQRLHCGYGELGIADGVRG